MEIVFASLPAYGHLYPLMPLALAAADAGHDVRVATGGPFVDALPLPTVRTTAAHLGLSWAEQETRRRHPDAEGIELGLRMFADVAANATAEALLEVWADERPDLVVLESANVGAAVAAHVLGVPAVAVAVGHWAPFGPAVYNAVRGYGAGHWGARGVTPPEDGDRLLSAFVDPLPPAMRTSSPERVPHLPMRAVGWSHGDAPLPAWLETPAQRPRVLLTLGTVAYGAVEVIREALDGLLQLDVEVLVLLGPQGDPEALGPVPGTVHLERFVPQERVLGYVDLVVHHGGTGNMLGALAHGLPAVVLPQGADQFHNAGRLAEVGAARALVGEEVTAASVAEAAAALLRAEATERRVARDVAEEMAAMPAPADVVPRLEEIART